MRFGPPRRSMRKTAVALRQRTIIWPPLALIVAGLLAACSGGDSKDDASPSPSVDSAVSRLTAKAVTPLGDGEFIVFDRLVPGEEEDRELYAVGPDGGKPQMLRTRGQYPHWSPDGSKLTFNDCLNPPSCTTGVALIERSTGEVHGFTMPDPDMYTSCAIWAPTGKTVACEGGSEDDPSRNGVYTVRVSDGNGLTRITRNPGGIDAPVTYSPDGRQLLFARQPASGGESEQALFVTPAGGDGKARRITPLGLTDDAASWSPDGRTIVFGTGGDLYRVSPKGTGLAKIKVKTPDGSLATHAFDVSFSPDGRRIVFSLGGAEPGIYLADPDGSNVKRLTTSPTEDHHANWGRHP